MPYSTEDKKIIADAYLKEKAGVSWDELSDINSLEDAETETEIKELCDERLEEDGYPTE